MPLDELLKYFMEWKEHTTTPIQNLFFDDYGAHGYFADMRLHSAFQPLFAADGLKVAAHEALLRASDGNGHSISPLDAFAVPKTSDEIVYFDRLVRVLHALNFVHQSDGKADLFVNISGRHLLSVSGGHGQTFEALLRYCGLRTSQIVLEILESHVDNLRHLQNAITAYRQRGYRVAIDDFGCENSNFDRLWQLTPDIVKLDRSLIVEATQNARARRILPKIVEIIHDLDAQVVCEGIETLQQHQLALDAGVDLVQGYFYAKPSPILVNSVPADVPLTKWRAAPNGIRTLAVCPD